MDNPLDRMILSQAEKLDSLPPQTSPIPAGKYAVKTTKEMQVPREGEVKAADDAARADIWFQTEVRSCSSNSVFNTMEVNMNAT